MDSLNKKLKVLHSFVFQMINFFSILVVENN